MPSFPRREVSGMGIGKRLGLSGLAALGAGAGAYLLLVRPWHLRWGSTPEEVRLPMPGDDEVPNPILQATRAVTIDAPASAIWPWLVQMGYGRAGFYGYDLVDNAGVPSSTRILPELQRLAVGDRVPTGPTDALTVKALEPNRSLLLVQHREGASFSASVALKELDPEHTRLVVRLRAWWRLGVREALTIAVFEPGDFLNMRKQLLGIKRRAERWWSLTGRATARFMPPG
ncbi:MAG: hypothetical protein ACYC8T_08270 [Myxococcaceae bacterium]